MFTIRATTEQMDFARDQIAKYNFGMRKEDFNNGTPEQQYYGIVSQTMVADILKKPRPDGKSGVDNGVDIIWNNGMTIDVKAMSRKVYPKREWVTDFIAVQKDFPTDMLICCSWHVTKNDLTVCGTIPKKVFLAIATLFPRGTKRPRADGTFLTLKADMYELANIYLTDADDTDHLIEILDRGLKYEIPRR